MSPPPLPSVPKKNRGCLVAGAVTGGFISLIAVAAIAMSISQCSARKEFPKQKAEVLQKIQSAGAKVDALALNKMDAHYGELHDTDFQSAMKAARTRIAEAKAQAEASKSAEKARVRAEQEALAVADKERCLAQEAEAKEAAEKTGAEEKNRQAALAAKKQAAMDALQKSIPPLARKNLRDHFRTVEVFGAPDAESDGVLVVVRAEIDAATDIQPAAFLMRDRIIALSASVFPPSVPQLHSLRVIYSVKLPDGLGNDKLEEVTDTFITAAMAEKVNWKSPDKITIHKAFLSTCHPSFTTVWERQ